MNSSSRFLLCLIPIFVAIKWALCLNSNADFKFEHNHHSKHLETFYFNSLMKSSLNSTTTVRFPSQVASLENASVVVNLVDSLVNLHLGEVPDLTPVASRQSLNSALSAASMDDIRESDGWFDRLILFLILQQPLFSRIFLGSRITRYR